MDVRLVTCVTMIILGISSLSTVSSQSLCTNACAKKNYSAFECARVCGIIGKRQPTLSENRPIGWRNEGFSNDARESTQLSLVEHFSKLNPEMQRLVFELIMKLELSQMED